MSMTKEQWHDLKLTEVITILICVHNFNKDEYLIKTLEGLKHDSP